MTITIHTPPKQANRIKDFVGNLYCGFCGYRIHPLNKTCKTCGVKLTTSKGLEK